MSHHSRSPAERGLRGDDIEDAYDGVEASTSRAHFEPPPSYLDTVAAHVDLDTKGMKDMKEKSADKEQDMSFADSPAQLPFDDLIVGSSARSARRSLPARPPPQRDESSPILEHQPQPSNDSPQQPQSSHGTPQHPTHARLRRPELPHAPRSAPDPRARTKLEYIDELEEMNPFGHRFHEEGPFEAARRAQRVADERPPNDSQNSQEKAYANGRMPSVKPGDIMPGHTMRPPNGMPAFFPPLEAPPFPPTIHTSIRPAHYPPEMHPRNPSPPQQLARSHSHRHPQPPPPSQPSRSNSHHSLPPSQPILSHSHQPQPQPPPPQPPRAHSQRHPPSAPSPPHPQYIVAPQANPSAPQTRRHTYDARDGIPPGLAPTGRYPAPAPPQQYPVSVPYPTPTGYPHPQGQPAPYSPGPPSRTPSQHQYQHPPQPGRSILKETRHSLPARAPSRSPLSTPGPTPVRLPSQNVPSSNSSTPSTPHSLALQGIVHAPPSPSGSSLPDPSRPPRPTPKPVMPQLLAPLVSDGYNYGRGGSGQVQHSAASAPLQRSASSVPLSGEKGGLLSKTRSILRKRNSSTAIKTHADGAILFAPPPGAISFAPPGSSKRYENQPAMREESGGGVKSGKRLSKRR